jgi:hypothetical protein
LSWLLTIAFLMTAARSEAQDGAMPATLLRRVAEAVQGLPNGYAVYVAVEMTLPYEVIMIGPERAAVEDSARRTHQRYAIVGPVEGEEPPHTMSYQLPCTHRADSYMQCPDSTHRFSVVPSTVIVIFQSGAQSDTVASFAPAEGDALFFNLSSMDKFVFPYYARVFGIEYAARMRAEYLRRAAAR